MAWFLTNNRKKYLEKLKKANQEREEKASVKAIGDISPEQKEQRERQIEIAKEKKELEKDRAKRQEQDKASQDQLLIVQGAKIKMGSHTGSFKVLNDVPTTQGKLTGTVLEKSPANFIFNDGFQVLSLTEWQDVGTIKYQDNKVLIKKSKIIATGKMPGNTPPETAPIEFIDSGQVNVVESIDTDGMPVPSYEEEKSKYILQSKYFHNHFYDVAQDILAKLDNINQSYIGELYQKITNNRIENPEIEVVKEFWNDKWAEYDSYTAKIKVSENNLVNIQYDNNKKIQLTLELAKAYEEYLQKKINSFVLVPTKLEMFEYEFLRFDGMGNTCNVEVATLTTPEGEIYPLNICLETPKELTKEQSVDNEKINTKFENSFGKSFQPRRGYSDNSDILKVSDPPDNPILPNIGIKFKLSWNGGKPACSISFYAGLQKEVIKKGDFGVTAGLNVAATLYRGTPGTSDFSPNLGTLSASPSVTLGFLTGNPFSLNLFNQYTGTGVYVPYEYAFTSGVTGVLSTGRVSKNYDNNGKVIKDEYNSYDDNHRHQLLGGSAIKAGNFIIASYNDVWKPPLFFGQNSDQYWSAGLNLQTKLAKDMNFSYAFDLYYGKSSNKRPLNQDILIDGQNYDLQNFLELALNRGQETFSVTTDEGLVGASISLFGYGCFWPSNNMHNAISWPPPPPIEPEKISKKNYLTDEEYDKALKDYNEKMDIYRRDLRNYKLSREITVKTKFNKKRGVLEPNPTFHWLYSIYNEKNEIDWERVRKYFNAKQAKDVYLQKQDNIKKNEK
ncbi:hypothetical protein EQP59_02070 [Ornithobacterium rhinotracheale]|uniref:Uncharacterized protein n=1 Tax=Ornithobacterium rhinotracheale TaxID=28251 RepID=A0A3R5XSP8_ORNRH|nr:hypothetical protein [Ornithobacterium rhinotracheale]QAR30226.1 hypothetical protein EQP59_02070 [Ornithobacterium rhinotracheale]